MIEGRKFDATMITKISAYRKQANIPQKVIADRMGYTSMAYSKKERRGNFSLLEAKMIAEIFSEFMDKPITINDLI